MALPNPGDLLAGKYELERVLGQGGYGMVYLATTRGTGRPVAVKVLKQEEPQHASTHAARFLREMKTVAQLQCEHTVTLYDFGRTEDGELFMVCEYIEGEDLVDLVARRGRLWDHEVAHVLGQALLSLAEAHDLGVLHRDIKPANLRITSYQDDPLRVKLLDFGLAKAWQSDDDAGLTGEGNVVGTPRYMAPEHIYGQPISPASDIFSLGLVAIEMLLGRESTALENRDGLEVTIKPDAPVNKPLAEIVNRMVALSVTDRYTSAQEVINALQALQGDAATLLETPSGPRGGSPERTAPQTASGPSRKGEDSGIIPLVIGAVVLLTVGIGLGLVLATGGDDGAPPAEVRKLPGNLTAAPAAAVPELELAPAVDFGPPDGGPPDAGAAPGCSGLADYPSGPQLLEDTRGFSKRIWVNVPDDYDPTARYPTIVLFGDIYQTPDELAEMIDIKRDADIQQFVVVIARPSPLIFWTPDVLDRAESDVEFAASQLCMDLSELYLLGHGGGGGAGVYAALCHFEGIAAIATTSARVTGFDKLCQAVPYLHFAPDQDPGGPIDGGTNCISHYVEPLSEHDRRFKQRWGCSGEAQEVERVGQHVCETWRCEQPYVRCVIDGGRGWPGAEPIEDCESKPADFPYRDRVWSFFETVRAGGKPQRSVR